MFVPGKLFQPSPMFAGKAGAHPSKAPWVGLQTLDEARKACQGQTLAYFEIP